MTAAEIIDGIKRLPPQEQAGVVRFVYRLDAERKLSGPELSALAQRFITATDATEASRAREEIVRGFFARQGRCLRSGGALDVQNVHWIAVDDRESAWNELR